MKQILRRCNTRIGASLALFLILMSIVVGAADAAPIVDPDFTTLIVNPVDLQKYVIPLPNAFALQIAPDKATYPGEDYYRVDMGQFNHDMQLLLLPPAVAGYPAAVGGKLPLTPSWGYGMVPAGAPAGTPGAYTFPGPTFVNTQNTPTRVTYTNSLPAKHILGLDPTLVCGSSFAPGNINGPTAEFPMKAPNCAPENRTVVHTHGAHVWDDSDGDPLAWFSNGFAVTGETWKPNTQHGPVGTYRFINDQEAGTIWYHDHAMGLTHLNVYAGLAGFFLVTDANEANLRTTRVLPQYKAATLTTPAETYEIPIALQDRKFNPDGTLAVPNNPVLDVAATIGPNVPCDATVGALAPYACLPTVAPATLPANAILAATTLCDPGAVINTLMCPAAKFSKADDGSLIPYNAVIASPGLPGPFTAPSITPEFFGNVALANGIAWPKQDAEQRKYRIRLLNGADSRTYFLRFETPGAVTPSTIPVWQIGTDQAFLDKPVDRTPDYIVLMPGERIDLIVDFTLVPIGTRVILQNYGPMATANGLPASASNPNFDIPYDGVLPVTGQPLNVSIPELLAFDVVAAIPAIPDATIALTTPLRPIPAFTTYPSLTATPGAPVRKLALIERQGSNGRFMLTLDGRDFMDPFAPITELPKLNDTEIWEIANFTPDAHPMHLHLVAFQLIDRQEFSVDPASLTKIYDPTIGLPPFSRYPLMPYTAIPTYLPVQHIVGDLNYAPAAGNLTTIPTPPDAWEKGWKDTIQSLPGTITRIIAKFDLPGLYVWHCHILSHEENDMMRPFIVTTPAKSITAALTRNGAALGSSEPAALAAPILITAQGLTGLTGPAILSPQLSNGFEYQFSITDPSNITTIVQPFMAWMYPMLDSYTWTPPKTPGTYIIKVEARQASASAAGTAGEVLATPFTTAYILTGPALSGVTSTTATGFYKAGGVVNVTLSSNQAITSTGLAITLNNGVILNSGALANVSSYSGNFTVAASGQDTPAGKSLDVTGITGTIVDAAGNAMASLIIPTGANISNSRQITIDTTLPTLAVTAPTSAFVSVANQTITGTATDPVGILSVTVNSAAISVDAAGAYSTPLTLVTGANAITVVATDKAGNTTTVIQNITLDTTPPLTTVNPPAGTYSGSVTVTLVANKAATIYFSTDGAVPVIAAPNTAIYTTPIVLSSLTPTTRTLRFFAVDKAGNVEAVVNSAAYILHTSDLNAKVAINNGKAYTNATLVSLSLSASDPVGVKAYAISTDSVNYLPTVTFASIPVFSANNLPVTIPAGDGLKTVYVKFTDALGVVYAPVTAQITLETALPTVAVTPAGGSYGGSVTVALSISSNEPETAIIYYTIDGTTPSSTSAATKLYSSPFTLKGANTTTTTVITVKYFAIDMAGNVGTMQSAAYTFVANPDMKADNNINKDAFYTNSRNVLLKVSATDPIGGGIGTMAFSDDGVIYTTPVPYVAAAAMPWTLTPGDALKTVYFRYTDKGSPGVAPIAYTFTSKIILAEGVTLATGDVNGDGVVTLADALLALQASSGLKKLTIAQQARGDVAPLVTKKPVPDGVITSGDVLVITGKAIGLISF